MRKNNLEKQLEIANAEKETIRNEKIVWLFSSQKKVDFEIYGNAIKQRRG
jgi:3-polyprenyl-4-hydroxybenzoate decarboxylase